MKLPVTSPIALNGVERDTAKPYFSRPARHPSNLTAARDTGPEGQSVWLQSSGENCESQTAKTVRVRML